MSDIHLPRVTIHVGDCLEALRMLPASSIDAVVTDPPYGLSFMGKRWDYDVPGVEVWSECLRVLKPGGHLLAFAGTRTQHRMACRIEDAGFEIRDMIAWVYGSGFPKSLDVGKAIDKVNAEVGRLHKFTSWMRSTGLTARQINEATGTFMASHYLTSGAQPAIPTPWLWAMIRPLCRDVPAWVDDLVERISAEREVVGTKTAGIANPNDTDRHTIGGSAAVEVAITTPAAKRWHGWGTALKPALEPITVARKPLVGTVAQNVLEHGTGAINVDACRIVNDEYDPAKMQRQQSNRKTWEGGEAAGFSADHVQPTYNPSGRWPANLIHDGSEEPTALLGSAARFFYCAKASANDRGEGNHHPTVKPTDLMRYLCRLVTPPGGIVLDPFMGSGSTGRGAVLEGFRFVGIEREAEYVEIAKARIRAVVKPKECGETLFDWCDR